MSPSIIGVYNFTLSMLPWIPAVYVFFQVASDLSQIIKIRHPGWDNDHVRSVLDIGALVTAYLASMTVWWAGLLLTKSFRCAFS